MLLGALNFPQIGELVDWKHFWVLGLDTALPEQVVGRMETPDITYLLHPRGVAHPGKPGTLLADIHTASISIRTAGRAF